MKKILIINFALLMFLSGCNEGIPSGETIVSINGKTITEGDLAFLADINPNLRGQLSTPFGRNQVLSNLVEQELLYQKSLKKGLHNRPLVKAKIDFYRRALIAQALVGEELEVAARAYYEKNQAEFETVKLSHILVGFKYQALSKSKSKSKRKPYKAAERSEKNALELAKKIHARLKKKENFASVAKDASDDHITKHRGGDLGFTSRVDKHVAQRGIMPLVEAAFKLKVGEISEPIKTEKGYHLITVTQPAELKLFEAVQAGIMNKIGKQTRDALLAKLKTDADIEYADDEKQDKQTQPPLPQEHEGHDHNHDHPH